MIKTVLKKERAFRKTMRGQRGITLVELLVVLGILALISAIVVVNVLPERDRAAVRKSRLDIGILETALDSYRLDMLNYSSSEAGLDALVRLPVGERRADNYRPGGYVKSLPLDPWGSPYQYSFPGQRGSAFDLYSLGADGEPGGEGLNADIGNWQEQ